MYLNEYLRSVYGMDMMNSLIPQIHIANQDAYCSVREIKTNPRNAYEYLQTMTALIGLERVCIES